MSDWVNPDKYSYISRSTLVRAIYNKYGLRRPAHWAGGVASQEIQRLGGLLGSEKMVEN